MPLAFTFRSMRPADAAQSMLADLPAVPARAALEQLPETVIARTG
jgi:hypothetical protein